MIRTVLALTISLIVSSTADAQISGNKVIGLGLDYDTITDAVDALITQGIDGDIEFSLKPGTYDERVTIPAIAGAGGGNEIVFNGGNSATWQYTAAGSTTNWVVKLDGADFVTFQDIDFLATDAGVTHGRLIVFANGAENNTVSGCSLTGFLGIGSDLGSLVFEEGPTSNRFNSFTGNTFTNGYVGVDFWFSTGNPWSEGIDISTNTFGGQTQGAVRYLGTNGVIARNTTTNAAWATSGYIGLQVNGLGTMVERNEVDLSDGSVGIWYRWNGGAPRTRIANNMVSVHTGTGLAGIQLVTGGANVYHNTVRMSNVGEPTAALLSDGGGNPSVFSLKNNLFIHEGGGYAVDIVDTADIDESDYNNFYTSGAVLIRYGGVFHTLASYQATSSQDTHSLSKVIAFASASFPYDLHLAFPNDYDVDLVGTPIAGVTTDFDGAARDAYNPYMGADEATSLSPLDNADVGGAYSVESGGDFLNPNQAIDHLNARGIKGTVTFEMDAGPYAVHRVIEDFPRYGGASAAVGKASATTTVTFIGADPSLANTSFQHAATSAGDNWIIKLDGADRVWFENVTFSATGTGSFGRLVVLDNGADDNTFDDCFFLGLTGLSSTDAGELVYASGSTDNRNSILRSTFTNGTVAIYLEALSSAKATETSIESNSFSGQSSVAMAMYIKHQLDLSVAANTITETASNVAGLRVERSSGIVTRNQVKLLAAGSVSVGIELISIDDTLVVKNNTVLAGHLGLSILGGSGQVKVFNNTAVAASDAFNGAALLVGTGTASYGVTIQNNILIHDDGGLALDAIDPTFVIASDNNNLYTPGEVVPIRWDGVLHTLASYQSASGLDANSITKDISFANRAGGDFHLSTPSNFDVGLIGAPLAGVTLDVDGTTRDTYNPYIGADEAISLSPLDNADVGGSYVVAGAGLDFVSPNQAVDHLNARGIKGPVTFDVTTGTYSVHSVIEEFPRFPGAGPLAKAAAPAAVRFQRSGPTTPLRFQHAATSESNNWVIKLDGADFVEFEDITFESTGTAGYGRLLVLDNGASNNVVESCAFLGLTSTLSPHGQLIDASNGTSNSSNRFSNSTFQYGRTAIDLKASPSTPSTGNQIDSNIFLDQQGPNPVVELHFQSQALVHDNAITETGSQVAILALTSPALTITDNDVRSFYSGTLDQTGFRLLGIVDGIVANNFVSAATSGISVGSGTSGLKVYHNSVVANSNSPAGSALLVESTSPVDSRNNILIHDDGGYALSVAAAAGLSESDYNDFFSVGNTSLIDWDGAQYTLTGFQSASGFDANSVAADVTFTNRASGDLHLGVGSNGDLDLAGTPVAEVTTDIDGDTRSLVAPYMGADEASELALVALDLTVYMAGVFDTIGNPLSTTLNANGHLEAHALTNPYAGSPWNCGGNVSVQPGFFTAHADVVDWVCLEVRTGNPPTTVAAKNVGFLLEDGSVVGISDGISAARLPAAPGIYSIVVIHRNHLSVMSALPVDGTAGTASYDFVSLDGYGSDPQQPIGGGLFAMWAGDANADGDVQALDFNAYIAQTTAGASGYETADFNLDGNVQALDFNLYIANTIAGASSQVP